MAFKIESGVPIFDDEDEKRKRERELALRKEQQLNQQTFSVSKTPSARIRQMVSGAAQQVMQAPPVSPTQTYFQKLNTDGPTATIKRMKQCVSVWRRYYAPYDGPNMVTTMFSSPYSATELEEMAKVGSDVLFNRSTTQGHNYLPEVGGDGTKDGDALRTATGNAFGLGVAAAISAPVNITQDQAARQRITERYNAPLEEQSRTIERAVRPSADALGAAMAHSADQAGIEPSAMPHGDVYDLEVAWLTETENWAKTYAEDIAPEEISKLEQLTGFKLSDFQYSGDWERAMLAYGEEEGSRMNMSTGNTVGIDIQIAYSAFREKRDEWYKQEHPDEVKAHQQFVAANIVNAGMEGVTIGLGLASLGGGFLSGAAGKAVGYAMAEGGGLTLGSSMAIQAARAGITKAATAAATAGLGSKIASAAGRGLGYAFFTVPTLDKLTQATGTRKTDEMIADEQISQFEQSGEYKTAAQQVHDEWMSSIYWAQSSGSTEDIKKQQEWAQSLGFGTDLPITGELTGDWQGVFENCADNAIRAGLDLQYMLKSGGYAPESLEVTGVFKKYNEVTNAWEDDPEWMEVYDDFISDMAGKMALAEKNPAAYTFLSTSGIPMTWAGFKALGHRLTNEGPLYAPLKVLTTGAYTLGGIYQSIPALLEMKAKMDSDPERQRLNDAIVTAVSRAVATKDLSTIGVDVDPANISASKAQLLVESGLVNDPEAVELVEQLNANEWETLNEPSYSWVGWGTYLSKDHEEAQNWLTENYNAAHAANIAIDLVAQIAIAKGLHTGGRQARRTSTWLADNIRARRKLGSISKEANADNYGQVASLTGGSHQSRFAQEVADYRYGTEVYKRDSPIVQTKAEKIADAVTLARSLRGRGKADVETSSARKLITEELGEFGKTEAGAKYIDTLLKSKADKTVLQERIAKRLEYEQKWTLHSDGTLTGGNIWGKRDTKLFVRQRASEMWSGADGRYYDIFPDLQLSGVKGKSYVRASIERAAAGMTNPSKRASFSAIVLPWYRAPVQSYSYRLPDFPARVADWVGAVTNDMLQVSMWRTKAALTDFSQPRAAQTFETQLQALRGDYLEYFQPRSRAAGISNKLARGMEARAEKRLLKEQGAGEQMSGMLPGGAVGEASPLASRQIGPDGTVFVGRRVDPITGEVVETVMQSSHTKHEVGMGRDVMLADVKLPKRSKQTAIEYAYKWAGNNVVRSIERSLTAVTNPLRVMTVGMGAPVLFAKHTLADSARTLVAVGLDGVRWRKQATRVEQIMSELGPEAYERVNFDRTVNEKTEIHYNTDHGVIVTRKAVKAFDERGRPKNISGAVDMIRRMVLDKPYDAYVQGGPEGLRAYLETPEGYKFLTAGGHTASARAWLKENGMAKPSKAEVQQSAIDIFEANALDLYASYQSMPRLNNAMLKMIRGERSRSDTSIRKAIVDAYQGSGGRENPLVDAPIEVGGKFLSFFANLTKAAMTPNRLNRTAVFDKILADTFDELVAQGLKNDEAAIIASSVARTKAKQVHFDLSEGMRFEMKHRWFAWFGTKHRLWNTWLLQAAAKNPGYAMAVNEFINWMKERNADDSIPEWDKTSIVFEVDGKRRVINMAPYLWLMDYAIESPFGAWAENSMIKAVNGVLGTEISEVPTFPFSFTRGDSLLQTIGNAMTLASTNTDEEWLEKIQEMNPAEQEDFCKQVNTMWAIKSQGDPDAEISIADCCHNVITGRIKQECYKFLKSATTKIYSEEHTDLLKQAQEYSTIAGKPEAYEWLREHPVYAATIGAKYRDPYEQTELLAQLTQYRKYQDEYANKLLAAETDGSLYTQGRAKALYDEFDENVKDLTRESAVFNEWMTMTGESKMTFSDSMVPAFPAITKESWEAARIPDATEVSNRERELKERFIEIAAEQYGLDAENQTGTLLYKMLKNKYVDTPLAQFSKQLPSSISAAIRGNFSTMFAAPSGGFAKASQYLDVMLSAQKRRLLLAGTSLGKYAPNGLIFATLTDAEKQYLGYQGTGDKEAETIWLEYARELANIEQQASDRGVSMSSTWARSRREQLDAYVDAQLDSSPNDYEVFRYEWDFSHLRLHERLQVMGFGAQGTKADGGWGEALTIVDEYWSELDRAGVGPQATKAAPIARKYLVKLAALANDGKYSAWWTDWRILGFTPSKLGFYYHWRDPQGRDSVLWSKSDKEEEDELIDYNLYYEE